MIDKDAILYYNGNMYRLASVINAAKSTNFKTTVDIADLYDIFRSHRAAVAVITADSELLKNTPTVLYKYDDKYVMLTNGNTVNIGDVGQVEGLMLSSVGLKKCRIDDDKVPTFVPKETLETCNSIRARQGLTPLRYIGSTPAPTTTASGPSVPGVATNAVRPPQRSYSSNYNSRPPAQRFGSRGR